ncbi:MAG TPA: hypothetical protein VJG90_05900 [Candidatus Nanoarchaeia archaeon]|nr:hypothetical protein [Candidatus Nanoarchaeia archaeon]
MVIFLLDADGAIKLAKAGILERLAQAAKCLIPKAVYQEILKGKEGMYEDAFQIEKLVKRGKIKMIPAPDMKREGLGAGERSVLTALQNQKADAVISDDTKFLTHLEKEHIPFLIPTDAILWLVKRNKISADKGLEALHQIEPIIRKEAYLKTRQTLRGE